MQMEMEIYFAPVTEWKRSSMTTDGTHSNTLLTCLKKFTAAKDSQTPSSFLSSSLDLACFETEKEKESAPAQLVSGAKGMKPQK